VGLEQDVCVRGVCLFVCERERQSEKKRESECVCVCACVCVCMCVCVCVCLCHKTSLRDCLYKYMQYYTKTHLQRASAMSSGCCTHDNDDFVEFPSTLWASIYGDNNVICLLDSFECNHTETAKQRDLHGLLTVLQDEAVKLKRPYRRRPCCIASDDILGPALLPLRACSPANNRAIVA